MRDASEEEQSKMPVDISDESIKQNCLFCKIASGEIPSKRVYEDSQFIGILDINPAAEGHILVMPKNHYQILPQMNNEAVGGLSLALQTISSLVLKAMGVEGVTVFIANGSAAGQKAPHFMAHIIPRRQNDGLPLNPESSELGAKEYDSASSSITRIIREPSTSVGATKQKSPKAPEHQIDHVAPAKSKTKSEVPVQNKNNMENKKDASLPRTAKPNKPSIRKGQTKSSNPKQDADLDLISKLFTK